MKKVYTGAEIKEWLFEKTGVPDGIYETSVLFYNKIIEYLNNNKDKSINDSLQFVINGDFNISDFKFNESTIEFKIDYSHLYSKKLEINHMGEISTDIMIDNFILKTLEYSPENNKIIIVFNYNINSSVKCINILKYFKKNKDYLLSSLTHELKHRFDDIKQPLNSLMKTSDYRSYDYKSTIPSIDYFIHGMYYTSQYESLVKNSEFYALLKTSKTTKSTFNEFITNSEMYKTLKFLTTLNLNMIIDNISKLYLKEVDQLLLVANHYDENMSVDDKIGLVLKIAYVGISNLKLSYLNSKLSLPTNVIVNSYLSNKDFYEKELNRLNNLNYINYYNKKLGEINIESNKCLRKLSKLYDMVQEQRISLKNPIFVKPVKWID